MSDRPFKMTTPVVPEQQLHEAVAQMLGRLVAPPAQWTAYPAGAIKLTPDQAAKFIRMGLRRGWPDLLVLHGRLYGIELKAHGGRLSRTRIVRTRRGSPRVLVGQIDTFPQLLAAGMADIAVCRSVVEVFEALVRWGIPLRGRLMDNAEAAA